MQLYIHVPFCSTKCAYCAFYSLAAQDSAIIDSYSDTLLQEMAMWASRLGQQPVTSIFFGGGTPSLLRAKTVHRILDMAARLFSLTPDCEITLEANPESALRGTWLSDVFAAGANRLSFGVQSFDTATLALLGRAHTGEQAAQALHCARAAGFVSLGLDLIWGVPHQQKTVPDPVKQWMDTLQKACLLRPDHISAYGLSLEKDTPLERMAQAGGLTFPEEEQEVAMFLEGSAYLKEQGYQHYEISNFSLAGHGCRHNLGYWEGAEYLGLGPAATSTIGNRRWSNPADVALWASLVANKDFARASAELLTPTIRQQEYLMLGLRMCKGVCLAHWHALAGVAFTESFSALVAELSSQGLAEMTEERFRLTQKGLLVSNAIIGRFFMEPALSSNSIP